MSDNVNNSKHLKTSHPSTLRASPTMKERRSASPRERPFRKKQSTRSHAENQERAYIAASRRSDRSIEARVTSARQASHIHKQRTGRSLRITEDIVRNEEMYEEDEDLPRSMRRYITQHSDLDGKVTDWNDNQTDISLFVQAQGEAWLRETDINRRFAESFPNHRSDARRLSLQYTPNMMYPFDPVYFGAVPPHHPPAAGFYPTPMPHSPAPLTPGSMPMVQGCVVPMEMYTQQSQFHMAQQHGPLPILQQQQPQQPQQQQQQQQQVSLPMIQGPAPMVQGPAPLVPGPVPMAQQHSGPMLQGPAPMAQQGSVPMAQQNSAPLAQQHVSLPPAQQASVPMAQAPSMERLDSLSGSLPGSMPQSPNTSDLHLYIDTDKLY